MAESAGNELRSLADEVLLRRSDDLLADFDRGFRMLQEFVGGCRALFDIGLAVSVFGSARFDENRDYWQGMLDFISQTMFREGCAEEGEVGGFLVTDSVAEAVDHIDRLVRGPL